MERGLLHHEREQFLRKDWPALRAKLKRLGITPADLTWADNTPGATNSDTNTGPNSDTMENPA